MSDDCAKAAARGAHIAKMAMQKAFMIHPAEFNLGYVLTPAAVNMRNCRFWMNYQTSMSPFVGAAALTCSIAILKGTALP
jgi:hypothetical protein